jgi:hypothetical protein
MKSFYTKYPLILALTVLSYLSQAQTGTLVWADEFNYTGSPAPADWNMENWPAGWIGNEVQAYTSKLENARVENGNLIIEAKKETYNGATWTSARIQTMKKHDYFMAG